MENGGKMSPRVSVVIPVYNAESYLERCLGSVLGQDYHGMEIILVDDGSTDHSGEICLDYAKKHENIVYLRQHNAGLGAARNIGIRAASAEYITFLDADDWFEPEFLSAIMGRMTESNTDIGLCDIYYVDCETMEKTRVDVRFKDDVVSCAEDRSVINKARLFACGKVFRKALFTDNGITFPSVAYEDIITPLLTIYAGRVCRVKQPLFNYYRGRPGSLSNNAQNIDDISTGLDLLYDEMARRGFFDDYLLEFKKIALGQTRFAYRKFGGGEANRPALERLLNKAESYFPSLSGLSNKRIWAETDLLKSAADKAMPLANQLTEDETQADYAVMWGEERKRRGAKTIIIPGKFRQKETSEGTGFDVAEIIMENL